MASARWLDIRAGRMTAEQIAAVDAHTRTRLARLDQMHGQATGEVCAACGGPLRYGDQTLTDLSGTLSHAGGCC